MFFQGSQIGPYTLVSRLGRGGFGEVWLAERRAKFVTTRVAVKLPLDDQVDPETIKQEATLWEQASGHPNILPIIDADEYDGQIVIVSEYAPEGSLEQWLKTNGKMPLGRAVETAIRILDGLEFLHSRRVIHRDLKPANILLQSDMPLLADFGISRALRTTASSQGSNISGTFAYMSPEGFDGKRSAQTDIWSVGVTVYQLLTGRLPFPQREPSALVAAIMMRGYDPMPDDIPPGLQTVIARALAKRPEDRYRSAGDMREDLRRVVRGEPVDAGIYGEEPVPFTDEVIPPPDDDRTYTHETPDDDEDQTVIRPVPSAEDGRKRSYALIILAILGIFIFGGPIGFGVYYLITNETGRNDPNKTDNSPAKNTNSNLELPPANANIGLTPTPTPTPDKAQAAVVIGKYLAGVAKVSEFQELKETRKIYYGDLDGDGDEDAVALTEMMPKDGGNFETQILAVFRNDEGTFTAVTDTRAGARLDRFVEFKSIKSGRINFDTKSYDQDNDPACCPSIKGKTSYVLNGDKLVEK